MKNKHILLFLFWLLWNTLLQHKPLQAKILYEKDNNTNRQSPFLDL